MWYLKTIKGKGEREDLKSRARAKSSCVEQAQNWERKKCSFKRKQSNGIFH